MGVRIIKFNGGRELLAVKRIKIHFTSGNVMVGDVNIHSKLSEEGDEHIYLRTSDYIKQCKKGGEPLTVFNAKYREVENKTFFVILDNVECICEDD